MGLDQYLEYRIMIGYGWDVSVAVTPDPEQNQWPATSDFMQLFPNKRISYITQEVGYWRKANQIHGWFVREVQNGNDDCGEYTVSVSQLKELRDLCAYLLRKKNKVLAIDLLPPTTGFFFGSDQIDEDYWYDLRNTVEILDPIVDSKNSFMGTFIYSSSW